MEIDRVMYIFGSFTRRRHAEAPSAAKRMSLEPATTLSAGHSPVHQSTKVVTGLRALSIPDRLFISSIADEKFRCFVCKKAFVEPRVLPCLHTFCTGCLQGICNREVNTNNPWNEQNGFAIQKKNLSDSHSGSDSRSGSAGSGYESDNRAAADSDESVSSTSAAREFYVKTISGKTVNILVCPKCENENQLPQDGILALPLNHVMQHRMTMASLNKNKSRLLCDLCSSDAPAESRCMTCLVNMCTFCEESHARQRGTSHHSVTLLNDGESATIKRLHRQTMCPTHSDNELKIFCSTCSQVICRDCCLISHSGHTFEEVSKAVEYFTKAIRDAVERTKPITYNTSVAIEKLNNIGRHIQTKTATVHEEVDEFIDSYAKAVEDHRKTLQFQVLKAREVKLQALRKQTSELEKRAENALDAVQFAEEILAEGTDVELLNFVSPLFRRLVWCSNLESVTEPRVCDTVQLLKEEQSSKDNDGITLFGIILTQNIAPHLSIIHIEGLRCIRVYKKNDLILETRDIDNHPLCHGGDNVTGFYRYCDAPNRPFPLQVEDQKDGMYVLSFAPQSAGAIQLAILINGKPIKDSPFSTTAQNLRPHRGKYHCCTFCSTGGKKEAECGCGSVMGGGYKGCGHGHDGHPGKRHWSCCGNTQQNSECLQANSALYQFSL